MTLDDAVAALEAVRGAAERGDHDVAHSLEDELRGDVLAAIAKGEAGLFPKYLARIALATEEIQFDRHTA